MSSDEDVPLAQLVQKPDTKEASVITTTEAAEPKVKKEHKSKKEHKQHKVHKSKEEKKGAILAVLARRSRCVRQSSRVFAISFRREEAQAPLS
jgi:cystathionine beta-lyase/cystathionine gamma-synthase